MVVFESTTLVMKFYWRTIDRLKEVLPDCIVVLNGHDPNARARRVARTSLKPM